MALHIRGERAAELARRLAKRRGSTMTDAVIEALEGALIREERPLADRLVDLAREARRLADPAHVREVTKQEVDALWGNE
jgi:antitoxin VapB